MPIQHVQGKKQITTHLWFDTEAKEAAQFYVDTFGGNSKIANTSTLENTPSGNVDVVNMNILDHSFTLISAGPLFKFTPAISFMVNFDPSQDPNAKTRIDEVWNKLIDGGKALMPIDKYPFSERYGWVQDKYGLTWQLILTNPEGEERPLLIPSLLFVGERYGKAEEAINFYLSVFKQAKSSGLMRYGPGQEPNKEGTVMFADFKLFDTWFAAMDGGGEHAFTFNEAVSFMVPCDTQEEIDYYWEKLSAVPESEQCGWLKDKFGVSWQVVPTNMDEMMQKGSKEQIARVTEAFLKMKKFDLAELQKAYEG